MVKNQLPRPWGFEKHLMQITNAKTCTLEMNTLGPFENTKQRNKKTAFVFKAIDKILFFGAMISVNFLFLNFAYAEERSSATKNHFFAYLETQVFSESPNSESFLVEYRTGTWSWDISEIISAYTPENDSQGDLTHTIETSIPKAAEFSRFSEEEINQNERAYRINKYYLDPNETDYLRTFSQFFSVPVFPNDESRHKRRVFELVINVFKKHGTKQNTIEAYLFWRHQ